LAGEVAGAKEETMKRRAIRCWAQRGRALGVAAVILVITAGAGCGSSPTASGQHDTTDPDNDAPGCADWMPPAPSPSPSPFDCKSLDGSTAAEQAEMNYPTCNKDEVLEVAEADDEGAQKQCETNQAHDEYEEAKKECEDKSAECADKSAELNETPRYTTVLVQGPNGMQFPMQAPNCAYFSLEDEEQYDCMQASMYCGFEVPMKAHEWNEDKEDLLCQADKIAFALCKLAKKNIECATPPATGGGDTGAACSSGADCKSGYCSMSHVDASNNITGECAEAPGTDCCTVFDNNACGEILDSTGHDPDDTGVDSDPYGEDAGPDPFARCWEDNFCDPNDENYPNTPGCMAMGMGGGGPTPSPSP
jgi:hypothetical protein